MMHMMHRALLIALIAAILASTAAFAVTFLAPPTTTPKQAPYGDIILAGPMDFSGDEIIAGPIASRRLPL